VSAQYKASQAPLRAQKAAAYKARVQAEILSGVRHPATARYPEYAEEKKA
jgi:hypothetical protein